MFVFFYRSLLRSSITPFSKGSLSFFPVYLPRYDSDVKGVRGFSESGIEGNDVIEVDLSTGETLGEVLYPKE